MGSLRAMHSLFLKFTTEKIENSPSRKKTLDEQHASSVGLFDFDFAVALKLIFKLRTSEIAQKLFYIESEKYCI